MLAIPSVKSLNNLETSSMANCLVSQNGCPEELVNADIASLSQYRVAAINVTGYSESGQQYLLRYCQQLRQFVPRFVGLEAQLKVSFSWTDAFGINMKTTSDSFYVDMACCLWNLASFESLQGAKLDRTSEDGLRAASRHFQQAAGYIDHIKEHVLQKLPALGQYPCLSGDGLAMVKELMLAQAQLCFYEKAVKDKKTGKMKAAIIAKLAKQTSVFYGNTSVMCKVGVLGSMLDISWFAVTDFQNKLFQGAAEYWQAQASKDAAQASGSGYGEEVARYNRADTMVGIALAQTKKFAIVESLTYGANGLQQAIHQHREVALKDLQTVYMESVPSDSSLEDVGPVAMVRASAVPELAPAGPSTAAGATATTAAAGGASTPPPPPLFAYVLPQHVRDANRTFGEEISNVLMNVTSAAEAATNGGRTALSSKGLPGSLEAAKTEDPLPPSLWVKVERVQKMGGVNRLNSMLQDLKAVARRAVNSMASIDESLDREERADSDFRALNPNWPGTASNLLNADIRTNNLRMREAYKNAQESDSRIEQDMETVATKQQLEIISKTREDLLKLFPQAAPQSLLDFDEALDAPPEDKEMQRLESKLHEMADVIVTREQALATLKELASRDVMDMSIKAMSSGQDVKQIHNDIMTQAYVLQANVSDGITAQSELLKEILRLNEEFVASRQTDSKAVEKNRVIKLIEESVAKFSLIHSQVTAGTTFYSSLQSKLTTLTQSCDDLAYTQQWQRQDYESQQSSEAQRNTQELADRDFALRLANELATPTAGAATTGAGAGAAAGGVSASAAASQPSPVFNNTNVPGHIPAPVQGSAQPAVKSMNDNEMVYGTPVSGPPPNVSSYQQPQQQQQSLPPMVHVPSTQSAAHQPLQQQQQSQPPPPPAAYNPYGAYPTPPQLQQQQHQSQPPPAASAAAVAGGYQYNNTNFAVNATGTPPAPAVGGTTAAAQSGAVLNNQTPAYIDPAALQEKTARLVEMGFPAEKCHAALLANSLNEEAALNSLLSSEASAAGAAPAPGAAAEAPAKPAKPSGLFGKIWGSK